MQVEIVCRGLEETQKFAFQVASLMRPSSVLALSGELSSGKTTFVKFLVEALGGSIDEVTSPTFVFEQIYQGQYPQPMPIHHFDFYRLHDIAEAYALGIEEKIPAFDAITIVEWADLFPEVFKEFYWSLECRYVDEHSRSYVLKEVDPYHSKMED
jgi:tRNA threonylcarbamoyladenosine biosynthesis protein TsaE